MMCCIPGLNNLLSTTGTSREILVSADLIGEIPPVLQHCHMARNCQPLEDHRKTDRKWLTTPAK